MHRFARAFELSVSYLGITALLFLVCAFNGPATSLAQSAASSATCVAPTFNESNLTTAYLYTPWTRVLLSSLEGPFMPTVRVTGQLPPGIVLQELVTNGATGSGSAPLHTWALTGEATQLNIYVVTVSAQNYCGGSSIVITLPISNPTVDTSVTSCPSGTSGTYPNCVASNGVTVSFDQSSLIASSTTTTVSGISNTPSVKLEVKTPAGQTYTTPSTSVVGGRWSTVLTNLTSGIYSLFLYDGNGVPLIPGTLQVTLTATVIPAQPVLPLVVPFTQPTSAPIQNTIAETGASCVISRTLSIGSRGSDVVLLQNALIQKGLLSSDSATGYFGRLTHAAVLQFQAGTGIVSSGNETTTGFGLVGARTRAALGCGQGSASTPAQSSVPSSSTLVQPVTQLASCPATPVPPCTGGTLISLGMDTNHCSLGYSCKPGGPVCPTTAIPSCTGGYAVSQGLDANGCSLGYRCQTVSCPYAPVITSCPAGQTLVSRTDQYGCLVASSCSGTPTNSPTPTPAPTPSPFQYQPFNFQYDPFNTSTVTPTTPTTPTTNVTGRIVYAVDRNGERFVYTMNANGTGARQLASCGMGECYASWSPDGTKITFERSIDGVGIYTMNADGSNITRLSSTPGKDVRPSYSPDGTKIIFTRVVSEDPNGGVPNTSINTMNVDGTNVQTILPANGTFNVEARYSPDGTKIVFMSAIGGSQQVFTMNANGSNVTRLTNDGIAGDPNWSSDGSRISFGSNREGGGKLNVFTMRADGSDVRQITHFLPPYEAGDTTWSPDNQYIAFEWDVDGQGQSNPYARAEVWIVRSDGSGEPFTTGQACSAVGCAPRWHP